jgi:hypothetical protein
MIITVHQVVQEAKAYLPGYDIKTALKHYCAYLLTLHDAKKISTSEDLKRISTKYDMAQAVLDKLLYWETNAARN